MSAAAIAWAISPPIVPAPTTAALKTNISSPFRGLGWTGGRSAPCWAAARPRRTGRLSGCAFAADAAALRLEPQLGQRALQRATHLRPDEEDVGERARAGPRCSACRSSRWPTRVEPAALGGEHLEAGLERPARRRILELDPVQRARLVLERRARSTSPRPAGVERQTSVPPPPGSPPRTTTGCEAVDPRGPAVAVEVERPRPRPVAAVDLGRGLDRQP